MQATAADVAASRLSLVGQTAKVWFAVAEARRQVTLAQESFVSFRATSEQVRDRFRRGVRPALDLRLALANVAAAEALLHRRREELARAVRQLELLVGRYPAGKMVTSAELPTTIAGVPTGQSCSLISLAPIANTTG